MKQLKTLRLVKFGGNFYSSSQGEHNAHAEKARKLSKTVFADTVISTDPIQVKDDTYTGGDYYRCEGVLVDDKEYNQLRELGLKDFRVISIHSDGSTPVFNTVFAVGLVAFIAWNVALIYKVVW